VRPLAVEPALAWDQPSERAGGPASCSGGLGPTRPQDGRLEPAHALLAVRPLPGAASGSLPPLPRLSGALPVTQPGGSRVDPREDRRKVGAPVSIQEIQEALRPLAQTRSVRWCGVAPQRLTGGEYADVTVWRKAKAEGWEAGFTGLQTCGSPWGCPCCMVKLAAERSELLERVVSRWGLERVLMLTLTVRHGPVLLKPMREQMSAAWKWLQQTREFRELVRRFGLEFVRALEATWSEENSWHPHAHALLFLDRVPSADDVAWMKERFFVLWHEAVVRFLGARCAPSRAHGVDLREASSGRYVAKMGLELAGAAFKRARGAKSMSVAEIAAGAAEGDEACVKLWKHWQCGMRGAKALSWPTRADSKLRELREECEKELAAERTSKLAAREVVATIRHEEWRAVGVLPWVREAILDVVVGGGDAGDVQDVIDDALAEWCRRRATVAT